uniref:Protein kinase domain-containing protein n=1 Tax=Meloidogyne floridensis TaxID=298350 RepID=A0A915NBR7_9BILA
MRTILYIILVNCGCVQCTGRGQQQTNSPPHGAGTSQQTNIGPTSSTQPQHEQIEYVDGHRLVRIPLIDYIRESTRNFGVGVMVSDSRNIFSYEQVNVDRSPSNMKNLLYQMTLAVEQFHNGTLHLNINPSNFICDNENGSNECIVKLIPGVNSTLSTRNTKNLNWTYGSEIYKSPEYRSNQNNDYMVSQKSDVYSLCLVAFEFVLRSANSERFLLIDSHFNTQLVVDSLIINLLSTNYDIRQLIDEVEGWIWRNDLIMTLKE